MLNGFSVKPVSDFLESRKSILFNDTVKLIIAPRHQCRLFYKNPDSDEVLLYKGSGK